ncbi:hypothetical protein [Paenibacillus odorifer]
MFSVGYKIELMTLEIKFIKVLFINSFDVPGTIFSVLLAADSMMNFLMKT